MIGQQGLAIKQNETPEQLKEEWHDIFNPPKTATYNELKNKYGRHIKGGHCEVGELKVEN